jgi:hypothetical protein
MRDCRDEIHLELGEPLRAMTGDDQHSHVDHQHQQHTESDGKIPAANLADESP